MSGDGYDSDRNGFDSNERGRIFENGTDRYFHDRENGYVRDARTYEVGKDRIQFDKIKEAGGLTSSIEDKSGRVGGKKDATQLKVVRALLEKGEINHHMLRTVEGEIISKDVQILIDGMVRDLGDKFTHQIIPRDAAREIWARGRQREVGKQLELPGVGEKAREQKAQQREQREKVAELAKARERAEKFQRMQQFLEAAARGKAESLQQAERPRQRLENIREIVRAREERARVEREAAERVAREFPVPNQLLGRVAADGGEREREKARAEREAAEKAREQPDRAREAAEAAERVHLHREALAAQRERAEREGVSPDVLRILHAQWAQPGEQLQPEPVGRGSGRAPQPCGRPGTRTRRRTRARAPAWSRTEHTSVTA
ncbi:hypothetical protein ACFQZZ_22055 [Nocardia sp. GCM10030253]|uniref:hypothetical protein n=1 Tax=Nocardia sp. GCM10030253 TaxID=3273404 RepID=UPI003643662E